MRLIILLIIVFILLGNKNIIAQVAINNDGSSADPSAILDLQSTNQGLLLPRIDYNDRPDPAAAGLLIYVTANGPQGNNALYMYNGSAWIKFATENIGVGSAIEGGIVFYLDEINNFGLVSATEDQSGAEWGCFGTLIGPDAWNTGIDMGNDNTIAILNGCSDPDIAAEICDVLELNGYNDWFLPSRDELLEMYVQKDVIGGFSNNLYWTSTEAEFAEFPEEAAWIVYFLNGSQGWTSKEGYLPVRCIRRYVITPEAR